jgi:hypothetical protein
LSELRLIGPEAARHDAASANATPLGMHLHLERGGDVVAIEPVIRGDLVDLAAEVWFDMGFRRGFTKLALDHVRVLMSPVHREDPEIGRYCAGLELVARDPAGGRFRRFFPRESLQHVAARGARRLIAAGRLGAGALYYFALGPAEGAAPWRPGEAAAVPLAGPPGRAVPGALSIPIERFRERAEPVGGPAATEGHYPVFFTREARERAERIARKGGETQPPVETGGLYVGELCVCPDTHEAFSVVAEVLEATAAESTKYSLTYSGPTWARIQAILRARRKQSATRHHRVLGQGHGHNFLPFGGAEPCEDCAHVAVCTRTTAYLSADDRTWCRAVFSGEPWQISQVFGLDARSRPVEAFYGQRGGTLVRRYYAVIDDFDDSLLEEGA